MSTTGASVDVNGISIAYEERGQGPPLLLIMGLGGQLTDWPPGLVDLLAQRFRVILFDNRDAGLSSEVDAPPPSRSSTMRAALTGRRSTAAYRLSDMADDAVGLLDHLGLERADVVGVSMGGMIAQQLVIDHPDRVAGLVSIMSSTGSRRVGRPKASVMRLFLSRRPPPTDAPIEELLDAGVDLYAVISGPSRNLDEFRQQARRSVERSYRPAGTARQLAAIQASPDRTGALSRVTAPTLVIHGQVDPLVGLSGGLATAEAIPGSRLMVLPDMGHDLPSTRWEEMVELIAANAARSKEVPRG